MVQLNWVSLCMNTFSLSLSLPSLPPSLPSTPPSLSPPSLSLSLSSDYGYARDELTGPCERDTDVSLPDPCAEGKPNYTVSSGSVPLLLLKSSNITFHSLYILSMQCVR